MIWHSYQLKICHVYIYFSPYPRYFSSFRDNSSSDSIIDLCLAFSANPFNSFQCSSNPARVKWELFCSSSEKTTVMFLPSSLNCPLMPQIGHTTGFLLVTMSMFEWHTGQVPGARGRPLWNTRECCCAGGHRYGHVEEDQE